MTIDQIKKAWLMSKMYPIDEKTGEVKATSTHGKYTDQMAIKTVVNRTCKAYINSSDDASLVIRNAFNRADDERAESEVAAEIAENANKEFIDISDTVTVVDDSAPLSEPVKENTESGGPGF